MNGRRGGEEGRAWKLVCLLLCRHCHALVQRNGCCVCPGPACAGVVGGCALTHLSLYSSRPTYDEQQRMLPTVVEPCCLPLSCGCLCKRRGARSRFGDATHGELPQPAWRVPARRILLAAALSPPYPRPVLCRCQHHESGCGHCFDDTACRACTIIALVCNAPIAPTVHIVQRPADDDTQLPSRRHRHRSRNLTRRTHTPHATRPHVRTTRHTPSPTPSC